MPTAIPMIVETMMPMEAMRRVLTMPTQSARLMVRRRSSVSTVWMPSPSWMLAGSSSQS